MKETFLLSPASWTALLKFLARADLKGHEVPEFSRLLQELERERKRVAAYAAAATESRPA
ncbi:hypothetical protein SAMN05444156_3134 [Verrucomicrobium sp. GAS474]|uniref:hypothetical protein n=1 Tax=Verrucomicrobium sp. GAS474 TaxID=1882831 RepID=UPI00087A2FF1|nr:hypothetical protein [Verrucomicrobium sp. GAS474]SDU29621.1 hypothetical protein SAMN05444156_3134 [Verrucomicrobium sp. GAS474]